jgi:hypothetical protein
MRVVTDNLEVIESIVVDGLRLPLYIQLWKGTHIPGQLHLNLFDVVRIRMKIAHGNDNFMGYKIALLSEQMREQGEGSYVVR